MTDMIPKPQKRKKTKLASIRLAVETWGEVDLIAQHESAKPAALEAEREFSRNEIFTHLIADAIPRYWEAEAKAGRKRPSPIPQSQEGAPRRRKTMHDRRASVRNDRE